MNDMKTCWMCGGKADSSEHRLKKADMVRAYGRGPYKGVRSPVHFRADKLTSIQGPDSKAIKYDKLLCHTCNTTRSQPFDTSYDNFVDWVFQNESIVLRLRAINFAEVFGSDCVLKQRNLYKYFAKSFGCRLYEAGRSVPTDVSALFSQNCFKSGLRINFSVNEDVLKMSKDDRGGFLGKNDLMAIPIEDENGRSEGYYYSDFVSWLMVNYWYGVTPDSRSGTAWVADPDYVYMGW